MAGQALVSVVIVLGLGLAALATRAVRQGYISSKATRVGAAICALGLTAMLLSDYPYAGNKFWAEHSVLAAILSSLLLVGVVFLAYETQERTAQDQLATTLSGAGLGGIVDHIVDVEVALALATAPSPPHVLERDRWATWADGGRPLRWLRNGRETLGTSNDPRLMSAVDAQPQPWTEELVDQSIRRISAGMRDWSTLIGRSEDGTAILIVLSEIRAGLMEINSTSISDSDFARKLSDLRARCRALALCSEEWSGAPNPRAEVLTQRVGLSDTPPHFTTSRVGLNNRLDAAVARLWPDAP